MTEETPAPLTAADFEVAEWDRRSPINGVPAPTFIVNVLKTTDGMPCPRARVLLLREKTTGSLGLFPAPALAVRDLAWSPAGYTLVATGGPQGSEAGFHVRAYSPAQVEPVWSFLRDDGTFNLAAALAIGPFGEVYAGGMGASGYPAVAYIGG